jgi:hypothetical protein
VRFALVFPFIVLLAACEKPVPANHVRFRLDRPQHVSLGLYGAKGELIAQPLVGQRFEAGPQEVDCASAEVPAGRWTWKATVFDRPQPEFMASIAAGVSDLSGPGALNAIAGGDEGPPCAVAADEQSVFLGWRAARHGHEVVAVDPGGRVLWAHHHGPGQSGVRALAAAEGVVYVLGGSEGAGEGGETVYKLDAQTGAPVRWGGREEMELKISSLWPADGKAQPTHAGAIAAKNGRVYLTFIEDQFIAGLDAATGNYVITLTAPSPAQLALSTTPMKDPQDPEKQKVIDFGVCAIAHRGLAYFVMEHDPAWVMMSNTRWLPDDETIVALTLQGDTMKSDRVTIYTALGAPHHQVQLRRAEAAEGFDVAVGAPGGRPNEGPWKADAFRGIRSLAVDAAGQLWVAEGDEQFGRFTMWRIEGKQASLQREIFGPSPVPDFAVIGNGETEYVAAGHRWIIDAISHKVTCLASAKLTGVPSKPLTEYRDSQGLLLWSPKMFPDERLSREGWEIDLLPDGHVIAAQKGAGVHLFALPGLEKAIPLANGEVEIRK